MFELLTIVCYYDNKRYKLKEMVMMKKSVIVLIAIISIVLIFIGNLAGSYNNLVRLDEEVNAMWAQVENQLKRRADLIPNLVNTVKGYASHEEEVFVGISKARSGILEATTPEEYAKAYNELNKSLQGLNVVIERYPELKANTNFTQLQDELAGTENRLAVARMDYNEAVKTFNSKIRRFPTNIIANMFGFEQRQYFEITEEDEQTPEVKF